MKYGLVLGILGTAMMTLFTAIISRAGGYNFYVPEIIGTMLSKEETDGNLSGSFTSLAVGYSIHLLIGIFFVLVYLKLWQNHIGRPSAKYAMLFGILNGVLGIAVWFTFFTLHPCPPDVRLNPYLFIVFLSHIVFAYTVAYSFRWISAWRKVNN